MGAVLCKMLCLVVSTGQRDIVGALTSGLNIQTIISLTSAFCIDRYSFVILMSIKICGCPSPADAETMMDLFSGMKDCNSFYCHTKLSAQVVVDVAALKFLLQAESELAPRLIFT